MATPDTSSVEHERLAAATHDLSAWRLWGPYVAGRQWGTVREDYSADGNAWDFFPFDHSHRRAYRWGEDGIAGLCDRYGFLNLAPAFWNGNDDRLKERFFGLTNVQGNHGEDVKEYWWHIDATPTHSYGEYLYRYPQAAYPYQELLEKGSQAPKEDREYELADTGIFADDRFFDITVVHAKDSADDIIVEFRVVNHGPDAAPIDVLGQWWFRNTWSWERDTRRPTIEMDELCGHACLTATHDWLGTYHLFAEDGPQGAPRFLFADNETNADRVFGPGHGSPQPAHPKDAFDDAVVHGDESHLAERSGTKSAVWWHLDSVAPGEEVVLRMRMVSHGAALRMKQPFASAPEVVNDRKHEADEFYAVVIPENASEEDTFIARRAFAGLMWCKQLYRYSVREWLEGDPNEPEPPAERERPEPEGGRNTYWQHLALADIISMPDEWEYPWFASWDLAFHCVALARIDPWFAKEQLVLMCREWCMHPSGQLAAYEWKFGDVNPPVLPWAARVVFFLDGGWDRAFLVRVFTKLLLNFGWWVNRKDENGSGLFEGGFLGMDNITVFDRSAPLPEGQILEQSDATSWMAFFCLSMLKIAVELGREDDGWGDIATKFFEHFLEIAEAMDQFGDPSAALWDEEDGFYYDVLIDSGTPTSVKVRSMVGLLPLLGVMNLADDIYEQLPDLKRHTQWLRERRPEVTEPILQQHGAGTTLSVVTLERLRRIMERVLDENEFLSPHGIRSLSAAYRDLHHVDLPGHGSLPIDYQPAESRDYLFGGNSNWRGPVWFPVNSLLLHSIATYGRGVAKDELYQFPTGSDRELGLLDVARELRERMISLFRMGENGRRPSDPPHVPTGPLWQAHPTFSEYFNGDNGEGLGTSHQTGWTAMVADLICINADDDPIAQDDSTS